jgi:hypothetical protein
MDMIPHHVTSVSVIKWIYGLFNDAVSNAQIEVQLSKALRSWQDSGIISRRVFGKFQEASLGNPTDIRAGGFRIPVHASSVATTQACSVQLVMLATVTDECGLK